MIKRLTAAELEYVCKRAQEATTFGVGRHEIPELASYTCENIPVLLDEIELLRHNLKTIESMTSCEDTKDFAKRALSGDASIKI